jgi:hypothetical protein
VSIKVLICDAAIAPASGESTVEGKVVQPNITHGDDEGVWQLDLSLNSSGEGVSVELQGRLLPTLAWATISAAKTADVLERITLVPYMRVLCTSITGTPEVKAYIFD